MAKKKTPTKAVVMDDPLEIAKAYAKTRKNKKKPRNTLVGTSMKITEREYQQKLEVGSCAKHAKTCTNPHETGMHKPAPRHELLSTDIESKHERELVDNLDRLNKIEKENFDTLLKESQTAILLRLIELTGSKNEGVALRSGIYLQDRFLGKSKQAEPEQANQEIEIPSIIISQEIRESLSQEDESYKEYLDGKEDPKE